MSTKASKNSSLLSTPSATTEDSIMDLTALTPIENSIITLIPCEYDPINGYGSSSEYSGDSSEIIDSSDDELETIKIEKFHIIKKQSIY